MGLAQVDSPIRADVLLRTVGDAVAPIRVRSRQRRCFGNYQKPRRGHLSRFDFCANVDFCGQVEGIGTGRSRVW